MNLSRLAEPESPQARAAAVAVLGAMLVGGCSLAGRQDLPSNAAISATQAAADQRTARVRQAVQCDFGPPATKVAGDSASTSIVTSAATPHRALDRALDLLPDMTYRGRAVDADTHLFTARRGGKVRVAAALVRAGKKWSWDAAAWCDQAELPAAADLASEVFVWADKTGARVPTRFVHTVRFDRSTQECYGELVSIVVVDGVRYVYDPLHSFTGTTFGTYRDAATLPDGAVDTGFSSEGATLWRGGERNFVYLVDKSNTRRLPREKDTPLGAC